MKIVIIGAGIAGLAAGIALRRAGHVVIILEQSSLLHEVGAAISIAPNASRVLRSWDFDTAKSRMVGVKQTSMLDGTTMEMRIPDYHEHNEEKYGAPVYAVHRVDLHNQLREMAVDPAGKGVPCELHTSSKVSEYDSVAARVTMADGKVYAGDLIVAADGVHSTAKDSVLDKNEIVATTTSWASMRWLVPTADLLADPKTAPFVEEATIRYYQAKQDGGIVWYACRDGDVQNFVYLSQSFVVDAHTEDFHAGVEPSMAVESAEKDFGPEMQAIVSHAKDVKFWRLIARAPIPRWHRDSIVLIGDAAHPMLPFQAQGGGQAIEDAAALGILLAGVEDKAELMDRLNLFEEVRHNRGSSLQVLSNQPPPLSPSVFKAVAQYLPEGTSLHSHQEMVDYLFSYDVLGHSKAVLDKHLAAR